MSVKNIIRNILKSIGLIEKDKLEELENLSTDIQRRIQQHNQTDPLHPDSKLNGKLYIFLEAVTDVINQMKKNNPNLDWNK